MTLDEAKTVARLIGYADGACNNCVSQLVYEANRTLPQFIWTLIDDIELEYYREPWQSPEDESLTRHYVPVHVEPA